MSIINHINRLFCKEVLNWSLIQKRCTQYSQHFVVASIELKIMFHNCYHAICCNGTKYLYSYSTLSCYPKGLDFKMLLDPFKKRVPPANGICKAKQPVQQIFQYYWSDRQRSGSAFRHKIQFYAAHQDTS